MASSSGNLSLDSTRLDSTRTGLTSVGPMDWCGDRLARVSTAPAILLARARGLSDLSYPQGSGELAKECQAESMRISVAKDLQCTAAPARIAHGQTLSIQGTSTSPRTITYHPIDMGYSTHRYHRTAFAQNRTCPRLLVSRYRTPDKEAKMHRTSPNSTRTKEQCRMQSTSKMAYCLQ